MKSLPLILLAAAAAHAQSATTLKDAYKGIFRIGAALNPAQFEERDPRSKPIIAAQFNTISPENALKWQSIHPRVDGYNFDVDFLTPALLPPGTPAFRDLNTLKLRQILRPNQ